MSFHSCKVYHILAALSTTLTQDLQFLLEHSIFSTLVGVCALSGSQYKKTAELFNFEKLILLQQSQCCEHFVNKKAAF